MEKEYVKIEKHLVIIDLVDLADAFAGAKSSYGPRHEDMAIEDYATELVYEEAVLVGLEVEIDHLTCNVEEVNLFYSDEVYDFVIQMIIDEFIEAIKCTES